jgi:hypothetical protein
MKTLVTVMAMLVLLAPVVAGAQGTSPQAPPSPQTPSVPGSPSTAPEPIPPRAQAPRTPDATTPRTPDAVAPGDRVEDGGRIFGLSPMAAVIAGLVILGVIIALVASRRRDRDVVVDTRADVGFPPERPLGTPESEIERERRRRAS